MNRTQKAQEVARIRDRFDRMINAILTDFRGMDVESITELRKQFREAELDYKVVKNTLVARAIEDLPFAPDLAPHLKQMTAIVWSYDEPSKAARVIRDFAKKNDKLKIKCGIMDGRVVSVEGWADMPSREELLAMIAAQIVAAPQAIMRQMVGPAQQLVSLIDAWKEKLEKSESNASDQA